MMMTRANAEFFGSDRKEEKLSYHNLDTKGNFQVGIHINEKLPISREMISSYKYRLQRLGIVRENIGRRNCHKVATDLISSQHMHLNQMKDGQYEKVTKIESLSTCIVARACRWTVARLEAWYKKCVATKKEIQVYGQNKINDAALANQIRDPRGKHPTAVENKTIKETEQKIKETETETIEITDENKQESRMIIQTKSAKSKRRIAVIQTWKSSRETKTLAEDATALAKIFINDSTEDWKTKVPKSEWVKNVILGSKMTGDLDKDTKEVINLLTVVPRFLDNEFLGMDQVKLKYLFGSLIAKSKTPADTALTSNGMKAAIKTISDGLVEAFETAKCTWDKYTQQNLVYRMKEKPDEDLSLRECLEVFLVSVLATIKFYYTTTSPGWMNLEDFPTGPVLKSKESAIQKLSKSTDCTHFKLLMDDIGGKSYAKRQENRLACSSILEKHFESQKKVVRNDGIAAGWPSSENDNTVAIATRGAMVQLCSEGTAYKVLDSIFERKTSAETLRSIKSAKIDIEGANDWAKSKGATKFISTEFFDTIIAIVEKQTEGSSTLHKIADESTIEPPMFKVELEDILGTNKIDEFELLIAPCIYEDNKCIKWRPRVWNESPDETLREHIHQMANDARSQGVKSYANIFRLIFFCLSNSYREDFAKRHLSRMDNNTSMSANEFCRLVGKVASDYDPLGATNSVYWREKIEDPIWYQQKQTENIYDFGHRLIKANKKAFPDNHNSEHETQMLCRKILRGARDQDLIQTLRKDHTEKIVKMKDPKELINLIRRHSIWQTKLGLGFDNELTDDQHQLGHFGSSSKRQDNSSSYHNSQITRSEFINQVVKLRRIKSKDKNVAENGDYIVRRFDIPDFEKERHNFNINDWMEPTRFRDLTHKCAREINKKFGTRYNFYEENSDHGINNFDEFSTTPPNDEENESEIYEDSDTSDEYHQESNSQKHRHYDSDESQDNTRPLFNRNTVAAVTNKIEPKESPQIWFDAGDEFMISIRGLFDTGSVISCIAETPLKPIMTANPLLKIDKNTEKYYGVGLNSEIDVIGVITIPRIAITDRTTLENVTLMVIPDSLDIEAIIGYDIIRKITQQYGSITIETGKVGDVRIIVNHRNEKKKEEDEVMVWRKL